MGDARYGAFRGEGADPPEGARSGAGPLGAGVNAEKVRVPARADVELDCEPGCPGNERELLDLDRAVEGPCTRWRSVLWACDGFFAALRVFTARSESGGARVARAACPDFAATVVTRAPWS